MKYVFKDTCSEDKKQRLFDFYLITSLKETINPKINFLLQEIKDILLKNQKQCFLNDLFFAISAEFRHIKDSTFEGRRPIKMYSCKFLDKEEKQFIKTFYRIKINKSNKNAIVCKKHWPIKYKQSYFQEEQWNYVLALKKIVKSMKLINFEPENFINLAFKCFNELTWNESFGGENWANIAKAWIWLNKIKNNNELIICIDHIYDLEHNSNTVFDKLNSYSDYGCEWIRDSLNKKAKIIHPYEFIKYASPTIKTLARKIIFSNYKMTEEKYVNICKNFKKSSKKFAQQLKLCL